MRKRLFPVWSGAMAALLVITFSLPGLFQSRSGGDASALQQARAGDQVLARPLKKPGQIDLAHQRGRVTRPAPQPSREALPSDGIPLYTFLLKKIPKVVAQVRCQCCHHMLSWCYQGGCPPT